MSKLLHNIYCRATGHNRGFGIHSPLAFKTVTDAISPRRRYGLYAYRDISDMMRGAQVSLLRWRRVRRNARLVLRLAAFFNLQRFCMQGNLPEPEEDLWRETLPKVGCREGNDNALPTLYIVRLQQMLPPVPPERSVMLVLGNREQIVTFIEHIRVVLRHGILFDGYDKALLILTPDAVLTEYKIRL